MTLSADTVFSVGSIVFILALVPALLHREQSPPASTGLLTGGVLAAFSVTYATLDLWYPFATSAALSAAWLFIGFRSLPKPASWCPDVGWKWLKWTVGFWSDPDNWTWFGVDVGPLEVVWRLPGYRP